MPPAGLLRAPVRQAYGKLWASSVSDFLLGLYVAVLEKRVVPACKWVASLRHWQIAGKPERVYGTAPISGNRGGHRVVPGYGYKPALLLERFDGP